MTTAAGLGSLAAVAVGEGLFCEVPAGWQTVALPPHGLAAQEPGMGTARIRFSVFAGLQPPVDLAEAVEAALSSVAAAVLVDARAQGGAFELLLSYVDADVASVLLQRQAMIGEHVVVASVSIPFARWPQWKHAATQLLDGVGQTV